MSRGVNVALPMKVAMTAARQGWGKQVMHNRAWREDVQAAASVMVPACGILPSIGRRTMTMVPLPSRE
jgi:hypothetical protein